MRSINEMYLTKDQYNEFKLFLELIEKESKRKKISEFLLNIDEVDEYKDSNTFPVANFPQTIDRWLCINCDLKFIQNRLKEQYKKKDIIRWRSK